MQPAELSRRQFLMSTTAALALPLSGVPLRLLGQDAATGATRVASGRKGVVASVHPLASQAAIDAFERGGNAIDAAVAASLMLSVVDGHNSGLGGGGLALIRTANGKLSALDGRERAPLTASPKMFYRDGQPDPQLSQVGPLAAAVPGLVALLDQLSNQFGRVGWQAALLGAAKIADSGFALSRGYASVLQGAAKELSQFPESKRILLDAQGNALKAGDLLVQADLANSLRSLADKGVEWFYKGPFAEKTAQFMKQTGGQLSVEDFAAYTIAWRQPIECSYREHRVIGFPPPSSGGVHIAQMLGMLSRFDVRSIFEQSVATGMHLLLEVMKRAMADRAYWLGDADFADVPAGLLDAGYLESRAKDIDLKKATAVTSHGMPPNAASDLLGRQKHTTHLTTADAEGNVVALTQTVNTSFGCKMIVPGTGVVLNNEMDDFAIAPGVRNAFGLVGAEANLVAPGKRPLSSMSPTIVLDAAGLPTLSCGAAGGPKIITTTLQILVRVLDLGQSIEQAVAAPRVHHQWSPDTAICEQAVADSIVNEIQSRGHQVGRIRTAAVAQGLSIGSDKTMVAAADPRVESSARAI